MFCLTSFCCVCLNENKSLEHLNNKDDDEILLINKLKYCAFENHLMGHKSNYICSSCLQTLKLAYEFKRACRKSYRFISKYVEKLTNNSGKKITEQSKLEVELIDIKECVMFTNMAHTYANIDYDEKAKNIEEIFLKNETIIDVKLEILENTQLEDFPQLVVNEIKEEQLEEQVDEVEFELIDLKNEFDAENAPNDNALNGEGFSTTEVLESKNYFTKLKNKLDSVLKNTVYNNINKKRRLREEDPIFKCPVCQTSFPDSFLFDDHIKAQCCQMSPKTRRRKEEKFSCDICEKRFLWKGSLKYHMLIHKGIKEHACEVCNRSFTQKSGLMRHKTIHNDAGPHKCKICSKSFYSLSILKTHMHHHQKIKPFSCKECGKNFFQKGHLTVHMLTHNDKKKYECRICHRAFNYKASYKEHLETHSSTNIHKCGKCSKPFKLKSSLLKHIKVVHLNVRDHMCHVCSKRFIYRSHLDRHMLSHDGEKIHKCHLCSKKYAYDTTLMTHLKSHFRGKIYVYCNICNKKFNDILALTRHKWIHTTRERNVKCPVCEMKFFTKASVDRHLVTHSGLRKFECPKCPKTYAYAIDLQRHLRTHEGKKTR